VVRIHFFPFGGARCSAATSAVGFWAATLLLAHGRAGRRRGRQLGLPGEARAFRKMRTVMRWEEDESLEAKAGAVGMRWAKGRKKERKEDASWRRECK
jgi:hypothetical protein